MSKKIVIIDDNFSIRHSIKAYLTSLAKKYQLDLSVFSTDNGVEGLGYIYITSPDIIVIDTTLPKYSGRAIVEFLSQNPRFQSDKVKIIILQEKLEKDFVVPSNFISINKNKKKSFDDLVKVFSHLFEISDELNNKSFFRGLVGKIYINANKVDLLGKSFRKKRLIPKLLNKLKKFVYSLLTKVMLALLVMIYGRPEEENITQLNIDKNAFRRHYYPTLIATFLFSGFLLTNLAIFGLTQLGLYNQNKEDAKALVTLTVNSTLDDADAVPGDGVCDTNDGAGDGPCTLRAAIEEANTEVDSVVIDFAIPNVNDTTTNLSDSLQGTEGDATGFVQSLGVPAKKTGGVLQTFTERPGAQGLTDLYVLDSTAALSSSNPLNLSDQLASDEGTGNATVTIVSESDDLNQQYIAWLEDGDVDYQMFLYDHASALSASNPLNLSDQLGVGDGTGDASEPTINIDSTGSAFVSWVENGGARGGEDMYLYKGDESISATNPLNLSNELQGGEGTGNARGFSVMNGDEVIAIWAEDEGLKGGEDLYIFKNDDPISATNPLNLSNQLPAGSGESPSGIQYFDVGVSSSGTLFVTWTEYNGARGSSDQFFYRDDQAISSTNPINLSDELDVLQGTSYAANFGLRLLVGSDNEAKVVWQERSTSEADMDIFLYDSGSIISASNPLNLSKQLGVGEGAGDSGIPSDQKVSQHLALDSNNNPHLIWGESTGLRGSYDLYYYNGSQSLSASNPLNLSNQLGVGEGTINVGEIELAMTSADTVYVTWDEYNGARGAKDLYLYDSSISLSAINPLNLSNLLAGGEGTGDAQSSYLSYETPALEIDDQDYVYLAWNEDTGTQGLLDMYYYTNKPISGITYPINLSENLTSTEGLINALAPQIAVNDGIAHVFWQESNGLRGGYDIYHFSSEVVTEHSIIPNTDLPDITKSDVTIDASTQSGADCATSTVKVRLSGENLISNKRGFIVDAENVSIKGFSIVDFAESGGYGIQINPSQSATVLCNIIGLEIDGTTVNPNYTGVMVESTGSVNIGDGTVSGRNIISGNDSYGVGTSTWAYVNIKGNYIGTDKTGLLSKGNLNGILLGTLTTGINVIGGASGLDPDNGCTGDCNLISGNTISGISFSGFEPGDNGDGTDRLNILGNFIGTNVTGTASIPNGSGIQNYYADSVNIGGTDILSRNVISGNSGSGMTIYSYLTQEGQQVKDLHIRNNYIGTNASGTSALSNGSMGIYMVNNMPEAFITGNVISGNLGNGIETLFDYTDVPVDSIVINDNKIGTQADGSGSIGNQDNGIFLLGKGNAYIGDTGEGNIINNNGQNGIKLNDPIPPGPAVPQSSIISSIKDNTIHNNIGSGIVIHNSGSLIQDNYILNNISSSGIEYYWGTSLDIIGNNFTGQGTGILLHSQPLIPGSNAEGANIFQNINTSHPAIDLDYRTSNDVGDSDFGENNLQNYPVLTSAEVYTDTRLFGTFNSEANTYYRIEAFGFSSLPLSEPIVESTIGSTIIQTDGSGNYDFSINPIIIAELLSNDDNITVTATKCNDNLCSDPIETSELSDGVVATILTPTPTLTPLPTDTPEPTATDTPEPTPTDTPIPGPTDTPVPGATNTPIPTATNTPVPTATNTPVPTATNTPIPTATNTPLPTITNTPIPNATNAVVPSTIPTSAVIVPSATSVTPSLTEIPTEVIFTQTPTTNPTVISQSPTPAEVVPTADEKTFFNDFPPTNSFSPPDESVVNHPIVKSVAKSITSKLNELTTNSSPIVPIVEAPLLIAEAIKPLADNFNYYLSLRFIGENVALAGISTTNVLAYVAPAVVTAFSQPRVLFHALAWFWKRKRKHNWGIVLDNSNNAPVAFASIIVTKEGKTIATATTDLQGKYGFVLDKGVYQLYINHSDYVDYLKDIVVRYDAEVLAQDIELTPKLQTDFDTSLGWLYFRFKRFLSKNLFILNTLIFSIGFVYTIFAITNAMTVLNYAILTLYLFQILLMIVFYLFRDKDLGQVLDSQTGEPLAGAIIRIFDNERQLDVAITDIQGRYSIYLEPGEYYLKVNFAGYVFPTANATNVITNKTGEKLFKFEVQESEKLN
ncbi:carboxypeptidase regulatory-like domain-containing protein, partial [Candidatus Dojkabacteria bacterium]|nr:carboxypeptidase regulatory-like domain-containing protein [Candidatus Dojkabacteria bacterium]